MSAASSNDLRTKTVTRSKVQGTAVFLGEERFEQRERQGFADAFRRLGWKVRWWPHEDAGLVRFVEGQERSIVFHLDDIQAPVPISVTRLPAPTVILQSDTYTYPDVRIRRSLLFDVACCPHPGWPERYRLSGHPGALLVPHAVDNARFGQLGRRDVKWDVAWVGTINGPIYERRRQLLPMLSSTFRMNDWTQTTPLDEVGDVYAQARIVVNIPRDDWWADANLRVFEAMGAGALLITPVPSELTELGFEEGRDFVGYSREHELSSLVEWYLNHEPIRDGIARSGRQRTLSDHTYLQRVESIVERAFQPGRPLAPARAWSPSAAAQLVLEQYLQERRWKSLAGPARGVLRAAGWRMGAAAWYLASRAVTKVSQRMTRLDG